MTDVVSSPPDFSLDALADLAHESARLIADQQQPSGAYPASPDFSAYTGYSWFRDGSFIADAMSAAGHVESADRFYDWCARVLDARRDRVEAIVDAATSGHPVPDAQMLGTRFTFDGGDNTDDWWDFQLDGYGTWLWAVGVHAERHGLDISRWASAISLAVDYLASSWRRSCYDWWEEFDQHVHVSTLGCIAAGFDAVARSGLDGSVTDVARASAAEVHALIAEQGTAADGHLVKWLGSSDVDASLVSLVAPLGVIDASSRSARATVTTVEERLAVDGGVHRYLGDTYYGGGQWPLLSCMLGLAHSATGNRQAAERYLHWAASTARGSAIPEQTDGHLLAPERRAEWIERWGQPADPLVWSSAMFLRLALELDVITPEGADR